MEDSESITTFMRRVQFAWIRMIKAGIPKQEHLLCLSILHTLPKNIEFACGTMVNVQHGQNLKLSDVESQLIMEERLKLQEEQEHINMIALAAQFGGQAKMLGHGAITVGWVSLCAGLQKVFIGLEGSLWCWKFQQSWWRQ